MKQGAGMLLVLLLAAAVASGTIYAVHLVGAEAMKAMMFVLSGALALAVILAAASLPIRAWRKSDHVVQHYYHDGTRTIIRETKLDGRAIEAPKLYQLPAQAQNGAFPELLRAAYQAGVAADRRTNEPVDAEYHELTELDPDGPAGWGGEIRP